MRHIAYLLSLHRIRFSEDEGKITFPTCPICQDDSGSACLESDKFTCAACLPLSLTSFLGGLGIKFDDSSTDFTELFEASADETFDPDRVRGLTTGYPGLDRKISGLKAGHLYLLAAETGMGKSVFAVNLLVNLISKTGANCSYFDLENGRHASLKRFIAVAGIKPVAIFEDPKNKEMANEIAQGFRGRLTYRDHEQLQAFIAQNSGEKMAEAIAELIREDVAERKARVIVIDPLENFELGETDYNSIAKVMILFKDLAQELDISILILHHVRKPERLASKLVANIEESQPTLYRIPSIHDLLGSSKITNIATDVWALVRQKDHIEDEQRGKTLVRILKQREGTLTGDVFFVMNLENLKFGELSNRDDFHPTQRNIMEIFK